MRLTVPFALFLLGFACKPPIEFNEKPTASLLQPADRSTVNQGSSVAFELSLDDKDGDDPLAVKAVAVDALGASRTLFEQEVTGIPRTVLFEIDDLAPGTHVITLTVDDGRTDGVRALEVQLTINGAPSVPVIAIAPEQPTPGDDLIGTLVTPSSDPEGGEVAYAWTWRNDGLLHSTGSVFPATVPASATEVGELWTLELVAFEAENGTEKPGGISVFTSLSVELLNAPPSAPTEITLLPSSPHPAQDLRCAAAGAVDPEGEAVSYRFHWSRDAGSGLVPQPAYTDAVLPAAATAPGETWRCFAAGFDGAQTGPELTADVSVLADLVTANSADLVVNGLAGFEFGATAAFWNFRGSDAADALALGAPGSAAGGAASGAFYLLPPSSFASTSSVDLLAGQAVVAGTQQRLGAQLVLTPDLSLDGFPDLIATADSATGGVWIVPSSAVDATGVTPDLVSAQGMLLVPNEAGGFGALAGAGRLNGDAFHEVVVSQERGASLANFVWVLDGAAAAFGTSTTVTLSNAARITSRRLNDTFGHALALDGDFTGDGLNDLAIGAVRRSVDNDRLAVAVFSGAALTVGVDYEEDEAFVSIGHNPGSDAGKAIGYYPDIDNDGDDELWMTVPGFAAGRGRVLWFAGGHLVSTNLDPLDFDQTLTIDGTTDGERFGQHAALLGDLGDDGLPELAISASGAASSAGKVYVFEGSVLAAAFASATPGTPAQLQVDDASWVIVGDAPTDELRVVGPAGDLDGDGVLDLIVGTTEAGNGRMFVWFSGR